MAEELPKLQGSLSHFPNSSIYYQAEQFYQTFSSFSLSLNFPGNSSQCRVRGSCAGVGRDLGMVHYLDNFLDLKRDLESRLAREGR